MSELVTVVQNASDPQYDIVVGGEVAGYAAYDDRGDDVRAFTHTVIEPEFEGRGLAAQLVGAALEAEREAGRRIVPECPYVRSFLEKHPEYADLVA